MRWILASSILILTVTCLLAEETKEVHESVSGRAAEEQLQRVKRVSTDDDVDFATESESQKPKQKSKSKSSSSRDADVNAKPYSFPVVLPPYGYEDVPITDDTQCLFYLENITVVLLDVKRIKSGLTAYSVVVGGEDGDKFNYDKTYVDCPQVQNNNITKKNFSFTVHITLANEKSALLNKEPVFKVSGDIKIKLNFFESFGFNFVNAELQDITIEKVGSTITEDINPKGLTSRNDTTTNMRAYYGYNFACSSTEAIWFDDHPGGNAGYLVGIVLNNVQIQSFAKNFTDKETNKIHRVFSQLTADCQPTFSPGSWMGIIVTLILVTVLMFGFLMLNSVQTMDRFDDPKQKQIVINFKE
ncbi:hypothetical protein FO519_003968 [Halicephalobus sp. NKZ332]|nr:hypothetical protein FO519_003968 [Halicephalobus sp. NKZ332]